MKKIKLFIASFIGAIALVFACCLGGRVNADTINRTFNFDVTGFKDLAAAGSKTIKATDAASSTEFNLTLKNTSSTTVGTSSSGATAYMQLVASSSYEFSLTSETAGSVSFSIDTRGKQDNKVTTINQYSVVNNVETPVTEKTASTSSGTPTSVSFDTVAETSYVFRFTTGSGTTVRLMNYITYTDTTEGEANTFTVKYVLNGGLYDGNSTIADVTDISSGTSITLPDASKITKDNMIFDGWKLEDGTLVSASATSYTVNDNETLTAVFKYGALSNGEYIIDPTISGYTLGDMVGFNTVGNACTVDHSTLKFSSGSGTSNSLYFTIPGNTSADLTIFAYNGSDGKTSKYAVKPGTGLENEISFASNVTSPVANNFTFSNTTENDLTIYIYRTSNSIRMSRIELVVRDNSTYDGVEFRLLKQFDDDSNPTKLRLIGEMKGVAFSDYANVSSVTMSFDFNGKSLSKNCTSLYKSVATIDGSLSGGTNTMYVVLTITGVDKYVGQNKSFTNVKMTINFEDGSSRVIKRSDIAVA